MPSPEPLDVSLLKRQRLVMITSERTKQKGELVQAYVRIKWRRGGSADGAEEIGQRLGLALRSRIDALGTDGDQLLEVLPTSIMQKLEELERQAALEDQGMSKLASERSPSPEQAWTKTSVQTPRSSRSSKRGRRTP
jgi:hypothetical protein